MSSTPRHVSDKQDSSFVASGFSELFMLLLSLESGISSSGKAATDDARAAALLDTLPLARSDFSTSARNTRRSHASDEQLRTVARLKLAGYTSQEIADQLGVVEWTVERKLRLIRNQWANDESQQM